MYVFPLCRNIDAPSGKILIQKAYTIERAHNVVYIVSTYIHTYVQ